MSYYRQNQTNGEENNTRLRKGCPFCKRLFLTESSLFAHLIGCSPATKLRSQVTSETYCTAITRLKCDVCNEYFRSKWFLTRHRVWYHRELCDHFVNRLLQLEEMRHDGVNRQDGGQEGFSLRERWCNFILNPPPDYDVSSVHSEGDDGDDAEEENED